MASDLMWSLYWIDVLSNAGAGIVVSAFLSLAAAFVVGFLMTLWDVANAVIARYCTIVGLCVMLVSTPLMIFVPSKDTMYMMLGIRTTDAVLNTDTGKKLQEIIQKKLDGYLLELDKPKK